MGGIVDINGRAYNPQQKQRPITKAQAGAIMTSEIDIAIERWNTIATQACNDDAKKAHLFKISFERFAYDEAAAEKSGCFGFARLTITVKHDGQVVEVYNKGQNFKKESELDNTNGYYPEMITDCLSFLIASGLMYNLATATEKFKKPKHANKINKPGDHPAGEPGDGDTGKDGK